MSVIEPYVEKDGTASGAGVVFGGRRYWLFGYCEGDHIWSDDAAVSNTWTDDSVATGIWVDDAAATGTWTDD
tara:strand:+ start:7369 stop:7584 length:216 start_codon:yes stop_codon:yes gene_type:complete